jgi:hypothetical protein
LRSPLSSITSTPPSCGAVAGSASSSSNLRALTRSGSHRDSDKKNCSRCTAGWPAPATGSAPASAVSVLFRSRGASSPARYSRIPRRCATCVNRSSNRAAYSSSGPGAPGQGFGLVITGSHAHQATLPSSMPATLIQQTTANNSRVTPSRGRGPAAARSRAAARTNELDADERRRIIGSEEGSFGAGGEDLWRSRARGWRSGLASTHSVSRHVAGGMP